MERESAHHGARSGAYALPFSIALVTVILTYWTVDIVPPALPDLKDDLALSAATAGLIYSILFLGRLIGNFPAAYLMSRVGTVGTACIGGGVLAGSSVLAALAPSASLMAPARVLQGVGVAFLVNAGLRAFIGAKPERGAAMTYFTFAATIGGVFGLQTGGILTDRTGWRSVFVWCVGIGVVIAVSSAIVWWRAKLTNGLLDHVPARSATDDGKHVSVRGPVVLNFVIFTNYSLFVALPLYAEKEFDASPEATARLLMVITVVHLAAAFPVGRLIRGWGAQRCLATGMLVSLAGTLLIAPMPSAFAIAAPLVLYGIGQVMATSAAGDIVLHVGGQSARSVSLVRLSSDLGLVVGPYVTGALSDSFGYRAPFFALPVAMLVAAIFAFRAVGGANATH